MAYSNLELTNGQRLSFRITSLFIIFTSSDMQVGTDSPQVVMNLLKNYVSKLGREAHSRIQFKKKQAKALHTKE